MAFPTLSSGHPVAYGLTHSRRQPVRIIQFRDGKEQRWAQSAPLNTFQLVYTDLPWADVVLIRDHFIDRKGGHSTFGIIAVNPRTGLDDTYSNLVYETDSLEYVETELGLFTLRCKVQQVRKNGTLLPD